MADPFRGGIIEELRRDRVHSQDIESALEFLRDRLGRAGIPFGLIGALALRHHGYHRFTEDIDILTTEEGLGRIHATLVGRGILEREPGYQKKLRQAQFKVDIEVVTTGLHAGSRESPIVYPEPDSEAFALREGILVATLEKLMEFKIASGIWGHRGRDLGDVQALIQVNRLSERFGDRLPTPLRPKFLELVAESRLEREIEE